MIYLSRYLRGGPINPNQIERCDAERISFRYKDHRDGRRKLLTLTPEEFLRRLLLHVPEAGQHVVRHYGLYAGAARTRRNRCRQALGLPEEQSVEDATDTAPTCRCGRPLRLIGTYRPGRRKGNSLEKRVAEGFVQQVDEPVTAEAEKTPPSLRL